LCHLMRTAPPTSTLVPYTTLFRSAALVTNPGTGEVLAMVGSRNYFDQEIDGNVNITLSHRQPGSSIKPINYAVGLIKGYAASTPDRKSTRLNSSHVKISYAVFCLK